MSAAPAREPDGVPEPEPRRLHAVPEPADLPADIAEPPDVVVLDEPALETGGPSDPPPPPPRSPELLATPARRRRVVDDGFLPVLTVILAVLGGSAVRAYGPATGAVLVVALWAVLVGLVHLLPSNGR